MRFLLAFACQLLTVGALPSAESYFGTKRVLYVQDNDPAGSAIIAAEISNVDGTVLAPAVRTSTGGTGEPLLIVASQDSVVVSGNYLFTTNGGDNTLSMFRINPFDPLHPQLVGTPAPTLGTTPVSVTYSPLLQQANAGGLVVGVTCFAVDPFKGLSTLGPFRSSSQPSNVPPPPGGLPGILSMDVKFNPSQTAVFMTLSNSSTAPGFIYTYPVVRGQVSVTPVISTFKDISHPSSLNFLGSDSKVLTTNSAPGAPGAALLSVSPSFKITNTKNVSLPGKALPGWGAYAPSYNTIFVADAITPEITIINSLNGNTISQFNITSPSFGVADSLVDRNFLYSLTDPYNPSNFSELIASPNIYVWDINPIVRGAIPKQIQSYDIFAALGQSSPELMGLAIWPFIPSIH